MRDGDGCGGRGGICGVSCLILWFGGLAINSFNTEYGFVVFIPSWRLRPRSGPRRLVSDSPPLNKTMSFSKMLSTILLSIWLSMSSEKLR